MAGWKVFTEQRYHPQRVANTIRSCRTFESVIRRQAVAASWRAELNGKSDPDATELTAGVL
jgi:hypothetical protein